MIAEATHLASLDRPDAFTAAVRAFAEEAYSQPTGAAR